jgi:hypothetical protein
MVKLSNSRHLQTAPTARGSQSDYFLRVSTSLRVSTAACDVLASWVGQARSKSNTNSTRWRTCMAKQQSRDMTSRIIEESQPEAAVLSQPPTYAQVLVGQQRARGTPAALQYRKQPREQHTTGYSPEKKVVRRAVSEDQRKRYKGKCPACVKRLMNRCPIVLEHTGLGLHHRL